MARRHYASLLSAVEPDTDPVRMMDRIVAILWDAFAPDDMAWIGFYLPGPGDAEMTLGPSCVKPACSPIGLHGICGRSYRRGVSVIVGDAELLSEADYVACDPRDRSELVIPLFDERGCMAVLDIDSFQAHAFDREDVNNLHAILLKTRLTQGAIPPIEAI